MSTKIDTKKLDAFAQKLKKASSSQGEAVCTEALNEIAKVALKKTINQTPRDTGNLARSWLTTDGVKQEGKSYKKEIYNTADYAVFVEFGHRTRSHKGWVPGQFMLTNALEQTSPMLNSIISSVVNKHLGEVFND